MSKLMLCGRDVLRQCLKKFNHSNTTRHYKATQSTCTALARSIQTQNKDYGVMQNASESDTPVSPDTATSSLDTDPLKHPDYFGVKKLFTLQDLFDARVHYGHKFGTRNEYMLPYIFGTRLGVDIIDLDQTSALLCQALNVTAHIAYRQGVILFVSRHLQSLPLVEQTAAQCGEYSHCREWRRGTFTNANNMFGNEIRIPDLCIFLSIHDTVFAQNKAVVECAKMNIMTTGIVDTSCDPRLITYPVPGNDDSLAAIQLYCRLFAEAIKLGKQKCAEVEEEKGIVVE